MCSTISIGDKSPQRGKYYCNVLANNYFVKEGLTKLEEMLSKTVTSRSEIHILSTTLIQSFDKILIINLKKL